MTDLAREGRPARRAWARSLRFRLTLWSAGSLAVFLTVAALLVYAGAQHALRAEADAFLAGEARRIAGAAAGTPNDPPERGDLQEAVTSLPPARDPGESAGNHDSGLLLFDVVYARVVRGPDRPLAMSPSLAGRPALVTALDPLLRGRLPAAGRFDLAGPDEEDTVRVLSLPTQVGPDAAIIQVAVPWDHNADVLERLGTLLLTGILAVLIVAGIGGWVLVGRTLLPIGRIVTEAERLDAATLPEALLPDAAETDSEIGHLVATLNRMTTRLRDSFEGQRRFAEAQQRFAADASHELRTPLTILRGEMELALARPRDAAAYRATLASAVEEVDRMSRIVEGLGFLARSAAGQIEMARGTVSVNVSDLCHAVAADFAARAAAKDVALRVAPEHQKGVVVRGDAVQLGQLLRNLLDNALKYTPPGGQVSVSASAQAPSALVTVTDTGAGIAAADLPHVFDRFWRADQARASEGSGLGLAICRQIAAAHGGTLIADSEPGRGSVFRLRLPLPDSSESSAEADADLGKIEVVRAREES